MSHSKLFLVLGLVLLKPILGSASAPECHSLFSIHFDSNSYPQAKPTVNFINQIPKKYELLILESIQELSSLDPNLTTIAKLSFYLDPKLTHSPATADFYSDRIDLAPVAFKLNKTDFKSMIIHEITHLIVIRKFRIKSTESSNETVYEATQRYNGETLAGKSHMPYAELLCDTSAILISRNPRGISDLLSSINEIESDQTNQTITLSSRDFSIDPTNPIWKSYKPKNIDHNRFNQIRGYLWHRWISKLPKNKNAEFYRALQNELEFVHSDTMFDKIYYSDGLYESNKILIEHLDLKLSEIFPEI